MGGESGQLSMLLLFLDMHYKGLAGDLPSAAVSSPDKLLRAYSSNLGVQVLPLGSARLPSNPETLLSVSQCRVHTSTCQNAWHVPLSWQLGLPSSTILFNHQGMV